MNLSTVSSDKDYVSNTIYGNIVNKKMNVYRIYHDLKVSLTESGTYRLEAFKLEVSEFMKDNYVEIDIKDVPKEDLQLILCQAGSALVGERMLLECINTHIQTCADILKLDKWEVGLQRIQHELKENKRI